MKSHIPSFWTVKKTGELILVLLFGIGVWFFLTENSDPTGEKPPPENTVFSESVLLDDQDTEKKERGEKKIPVEENTSVPSPEISVEGFQPASEEISKEMEDDHREGSSDLDKYFAAKKKSDVLGCQGISDEALQKKCVNSIALKVSIQQKSLTGCDTLVDKKSQLYCRDSILFDRATKEMSLDLCLEISTKKLQLRCQQEQEFSISQRAKTKKDCDILTIEKYKSSCTQKFLTEKDFAFSPLLCEELPTLSERVLCQKMTISSAISQGKTIHCDTFLGDIQKYCTDKKQYSIDQKWLSKAVSSQHLPYCKQINAQKEKALCLQQVLYDSAWSKKDISICDQIENKDIAEQCTQEHGRNINLFFYRKAKTENNTAHCLKIFDPGISKKCTAFFQ